MNRFASLAWLARAGLCLAFVYSGISKLFDFDSAIDEQAKFGLSPPAVFAALTIALQLGASTLVLLTRGWPAALGAAGLAGFTALATLIAHAFWNTSGAQRFADLNTFLEHIGLISGFVLIMLQELDGTASDRARHAPPMRQDHLPRS
jgi:uncharacterized membrane protein YphA (DoxX/SURF4 family)